MEVWQRNEWGGQHWDLWAGLSMIARLERQDSRCVLWGGRTCTRVLLTLVCVLVTIVASKPVGKKERMNGGVDVGVGVWCECGFW